MTKHILQKQHNGIIIRTFFEELESLGHSWVRITGCCILGDEMVDEQCVRREVARIMWREYIKNGWEYWRAVEAEDEGEF